MKYKIKTNILIFNTAMQCSQGIMSIGGIANGIISQLYSSRRIKIIFAAWHPDVFSRQYLLQPTTSLTTVAPTMPILPSLIRWPWKMLKDGAAKSGDARSSIQNRSISLPMVRYSDKMPARWERERERAMLLIEKWTTWSRCDIDVYIWHKVLGWWLMGMRSQMSRGYVK